MSLDHTVSMCIGGVAYRLPLFVTTEDRGVRGVALLDECGDFWAWDSAHVRQRCAERHVEIREVTP